MLKLTTLAAALALSVCAAQAETTYRAASAFGPVHMNAVTTFPVIFDKVKQFTGGEYVGQDFPSGLLTPQEMVNGLRDGIADMGSVVLLYFPAQFVESILPGDLSFLGKDTRAIGAAATEYIATCAECIAEFTAAGQVYLGSSSTSPYQVLAIKPVDNLEAFKGLRIRASGAVFTRWAQYMGATTVQLPSSEVFEALNQGVIDATYGSLPELINAGLFDVIKDVTLINLGVFSSDGVANVSKAFWADLAPETRTAFAKAVQYAAVAATGAWVGSADKALATGKERGIAFIEPSAEIRAKIDAFVAEQIAKAPEILTEKGVKNAAEKVARYRALVEKWEKIVADIPDDDEAALAEARIREIWSKIDIATYGN